MVTPKLRGAIRRECRRLTQTASGLCGYVQSYRNRLQHCIKSVLKSFSPASSSMSTDKSNTAKGIRPEHIVRTAAEPRTGGMFMAVIKEISDLSPTVKGFSFEVDG